MKNVLKELYNKILYRKYKTKVDEVNNLTYGDEIYCFIDDNKELLKIEKDQLANFVFLAFKLPYIYCLYKSDSKKKGFYKLNDKTHVDVDTVYKIHIKNFISIKHNSTTKKDLEKLSKKVNCTDLFIKRKIVSSSSINVGDIIERNNNKYFVSEIIDGGIIAYQIHYHKEKNYIYLIKNMYIDKNEPSYIIRDYYFYCETNLVNIEEVIKELKESDHINYSNVKKLISSVSVSYYKNDNEKINLFIAIKENVMKFIEVLLSFTNYLTRLIDINLEYKQNIGTSP